MQDLRFRISLPRGNAGMAAIWVALVILPILGFVALGVDTGWYIISGQRAQTLADEGALAGARELAQIFEEQNNSYLDISGNDRYALRSAGTTRIQNRVSAHLQGRVPGGGQVDVWVGRWQRMGDEYTFLPWEGLPFRRFCNAVLVTIQNVEVQPLLMRILGMEEGTTFTRQATASLAKRDSFPQDEVIWPFAIDAAWFRNQADQPNPWMSWSAEQPMPPNECLVINTYNETGDGNILARPVEQPFVIQATWQALGLSLFNLICDGEITDNSALERVFCRAMGSARGAPIPALQTQFSNLGNLDQINVDRLENVRILGDAMVCALRQDLGHGQCTDCEEDFCCWLDSVVDNNCLPDPADPVMRQEWIDAFRIGLLQGLPDLVKMMWVNLILMAFVDHVSTQHMEIVDPLDCPELEFDGEIFQARTELESEEEGTCRYVVEETGLVETMEWDVPYVPPSPYWFHHLYPRIVGGFGVLLSVQVPLVENYQFNRRWQQRIVREVVRVQGSMANPLDMWVPVFENVGDRCNLAGDDARAIRGFARIRVTGVDFLNVRGDRRFQRQVCATNILWGGRTPDQDEPVCYGFVDTGWSQSWSYRAPDDFIEGESWEWAWPRGANAAVNPPDDSWTAILSTFRDFMAVRIEVLETWEDPEGHPRFPLHSADGRVRGTYEVGPRLVR